MASPSDTPTVDIRDIFRADDVVYVPSQHNNCGDDVPVSIGVGPGGRRWAIAPARCRGCGWRLTPAEQADAEAAALAEVARG